MAHFFFKKKKKELYLSRAWIQQLAIWLFGSFTVYFVITSIIFSLLLTTDLTSRFLLKRVPSNF